MFQKKKTLFSSLFLEKYYFSKSPIENTKAVANPMQIHQRRNKSILTYINNFSKKMYINDVLTFWLPRKTKIILKGII